MNFICFVVCVLFIISICLRIFLYNGNGLVWMELKVFLFLEVLFIDKVNNVLEFLVKFFFKFGYVWFLSVYEYYWRKSV